MILLEREVYKMAISSKIKGMLNFKGKKIYELAEYFNISAQAMSNKFNRDSFSAEDLIKIADFSNCKLALIIDDDQKIIFDLNDIKAGEL